MRYIAIIEIICVETIVILVCIQINSNSFKNEITNKLLNVR